MDEGLDLIDALWSARRPLDFRGHFFSTSAAMCLPGPLQKPRPPVWLGEARHADWLDVIARHADGWNSTPASVARLREKLDTLRQSQPISSIGSPSTIQTRSPGSQPRGTSRTGSRRSIA